MGFAWVKDISYMQWVISGIKHLSIWVSPTQFQKLSNNFKIEFPGNWTKTLSDLMNQDDSLKQFQIFDIKKSLMEKKVLSISHPGIQPTDVQVGQSN